MRRPSWEADALPTELHPRNSLKCSALARVRLVEACTTFQRGILHYISRSGASSTALLGPRGRFGGDIQLDELTVFGARTTSRTAYELHSLTLVVANERRVDRVVDVDYPEGSGADRTEIDPKFLGPYIGTSFVF